MHEKNIFVRFFRVLVHPLHFQLTSTDNLIYIKKLIYNIIFLNLPGLCPTQFICFFFIYCEYNLIQTKKIYFERIFLSTKNFSILYSYKAISLKFNIDEDKPFTINI